jgi:MoxR-like ATPase
MQEGTVTTGGQTYTLEQPFFVLATQNPIEQEGTFPLPEAQLDRFMFKVVVPFLNRAELNEVVSRTILRQSADIETVIDGPRILHLRTVLDRVVVSDPMRDYACRLVLATHPDTEFSPDRAKQFLRWGASPRAAQALIKAARVRALSQGRPHVAFEDVRYFAAEVLQHRALLNYDGQAENVAVPDLIDECVRTLPTDG